MMCTLLICVMMPKKTPYNYWSNKDTKDSISTVYVYQSGFFL